MGIVTIQRATLRKFAKGGPLFIGTLGFSLSRYILVVMFNNTFYRFLFGFLAIIASTLVIILLVGSNQS